MALHEEGRPHARALFVPHAIRAHGARLGFRSRSCEVRNWLASSTQRAGMGIVLGLHFDLRLLELVDLLPNHLHFLKLTSHWNKCQ
jgi:hypothetical protein